MLDCLGFLKGSCTPHDDGEADRRPSLHDFLRQGEIAPGIAIDEGAAAHFVDEALATVATSGPEAKAYHVEIVDGAVSEVALPATYVGRD